MPQQGKNMAGLILQALTSSSRCMHQEGCRLEFHPQVGLHLLRPGSLASRDQQPWREVALLSLSSVSFRHLEGAPQPPPGPDSFLVTFPAPLPSDLSSAGSSLPLPFLQGADSLPSFPTSFSHCPRASVYPQGGGSLTGHFLGSLLCQQDYEAAPGSGQSRAGSKVDRGWVDLAPGYREDWVPVPRALGQSGWDIRKP